MFDPTAYENIKVVLEGLIYDYDLNGDIVIIERNDLVNLANLSRSFNIAFTHVHDKHQFVKGKIEIAATFEQIAAEWVRLTEKPGASLTINFNFTTTLTEIMEKRVVKILKQTFDLNYDLKWTKQHHSDQRIDYQFHIDRLQPISEGSMSELESITEKSIKTLIYIYENLKL